MKNKNRGFILIETLIVSVFILTTLIFLFVQFQKIDTSYNTTFKYNATDSLYSVNNVKNYLLNNGYSSLSMALTANNLKYINISSCPATYLTNITFCANLFITLGVKSAIFTNENTTVLVNDLKNAVDLSESMKDFIKYIKYSNEPTKYRLVVEFNNGTFGSLKIY